MIDGFYRAFEDKHRGTLELIKERQRVYLPIIKPLLDIYPAAPTIDLGCGRGEWLELMAESGFDAHGIDLDDGMLAECRRRGLQVKTQDALAALNDLSDNSQAIVSGFHFAEHIPFEVLQKVVQQALRVLKPAGLLILETPNPENIAVGTANFYLDPSHNRPLPPLLMEFLPEYYGFHRVKILRLQEPFNLSAQRKFGIHDVLGGVSPDYAVVAQKGADLDVLQRVSHALDKEYGVTLGGLSSHYEQQREDAHHKLNLLIQQVDSNQDRRLVDQDRRLVDQDRRLVDQDRRLVAIEQHLQRIEARRPSSIVKRAIKQVLRVLGAQKKAFFNRHPFVHRKFLATASKLGLYKLRAWILGHVGSRAPTAAPEHASSDTADVSQVLAQQPAAIKDAFKDLEAAIKKAEDR
jgi:O-antigen chain-terminating methyltransferase